MQSNNFQIYSGAGNDFVMVNNLNGNFPDYEQSDLTVQLCNGNYNQVDGVIFINKPSLTEADVKMNYYNRDGSFGAMCGNGARCTAMYVYKNGIITDKNINVEAVGNLYESVITSEETVKVFFPPPEQITVNLQINVELGSGLKPLDVSYVNVGSDHVIVLISEETNKQTLGISNLDELQIEHIGKILRYHNKFHPRGVNANFASVLNVEEIRVRTYERGVERETLACGTGIISTAISAFILQKVFPPVKVLTQSKEWLTVDFRIENDEIVNLTLEGSARRIK
jgi:diaminopimelate epimerase